MNLTDALLLDPYAFNFFIAYRTDGNKGTGSTINDPYNGCPSYSAPIKLTGLSISGLETTATTQEPHGLQNGDAVTIDGVTGNGAERLNGTFPIYSASGNTFKYCTVAAPAASPSGSDVITASRVTRFNFDDAMNALPAGCRVHLGPTPPGKPYLTRGYAEGVASGFQLKTGANLSGAGVDATVIQLVPGIGAAHYFAFGHDLSVGNPAIPNPLDNARISDLTIDCSFTVPPGTAAACGAVRLMGRHCRVERVKALHWGSTLSGHPAFVLALITADPATGAAMTNIGLEDCTAVEPATSTTGEILILHAGGKDHDALHELEAYGDSAFIRNCYVDGDANGDLGNGTDYRSKFRALSVSSCNSGVIQGNHIQNCWTAGPYLTQWSARQIILRKNVFRNVVYGPRMSMPGPGSPITLSSLAWYHDPSFPNVAEATTATDHDLVPGDRVLIAGADQPIYNGVFKVWKVLEAAKFRYLAELTDSGLNSDATGSSLRMKKVLGVEKLVIEHNLVELAPLTSGTTPIAILLQADAAILLGVDYAYGEVHIRNNRVRYLDGLLDASFLGYAMDVTGARSLFVTGSMVESALENPFQQHSCGNVSYFENRDTDGVLLGFIDPVTGKILEELDAPAEDAFALSCFDRL